MLRFLVRRQALDARHHGPCEPEGRLCCEEATLIADSSSGMHLAGFAGDDLSRCVFFCGGHAQDAWHLGRYGPEGQYVARRLFRQWHVHGWFAGYVAHHYRCPVSTCRKLWSPAVAIRRSRRAVSVWQQRHVRTVPLCSLQLARVVSSGQLRRSFWGPAHRCRAEGVMSTGTCPIISCTG